MFARKLKRRIDDLDRFAGELGRRIIRLETRQREIDQAVAAAIKSLGDGLRANADSAEKALSYLREVHQSSLHEVTRAARMAVAAAQSAHDADASRLVAGALAVDAPEPSDVPETDDPEPEDEWDIPDDQLIGQFGGQEPLTNE